MTLLLYLVLSVFVITLAIQIAIGLVELAVSLFLILSGTVLWTIASLADLLRRLWKTAIGEETSNS